MGEGENAREGKKVSLLERTLPGRKKECQIEGKKSRGGRGNERDERGYRGRLKGERQGNFYLPTFTFTLLSCALFIPSRFSTCHNIFL
jgi:hypothetical protein